MKVYLSEDRGKYDKEGKISRLGMITDLELIEPALNQLYYLINGADVELYVALVESKDNNVNRKTVLEGVTALPRWPETVINEYEAFEELSVEIPLAEVVEGINKVRDSKENIEVVNNNIFKEWAGKVPSWQKDNRLKLVLVPDDEDFLELRKSYLMNSEWEVSEYSEGSKNVSKEFS